jgi:hypothetical protein
VTNHLARITILHDDSAGLREAFKGALMKKLLTLPAALLFSSLCASPQNPIPTDDPSYYGPFHGTFWADGEGLKKSLANDDRVLRADFPCTLYGWVLLGKTPKGPTLIAGVGKAEDEYPRYLGIDGDKLLLWMGKDNALSAPAQFSTDKWGRRRSACPRAHSER